MKKSCRLICLILILTMTLALCLPLSAAGLSIDAALSESAAYLLRTVRAPQVSSVGGEWAVLALARSGYDVPQSYWDGYYATVEQYLNDNGGVLHDRKYTEYSRVIIALTAIGADPASVGGYNLLIPLGDFDKTVWQGTSGPIWALLALDSGGYDVPINPSASTQASRQMYINEILARQLDGGGWNLSDRGGSGQADPDVTGMALQALAKYQDREEIVSSIDRALSCLSAMQESDGGYSGWGAATSESVIQVIVGLTELSIPLDDPRFIKNGNTLLDNLFSYRRSDGSFLHTATGADSDLMASEQGLYALSAVSRANKGVNSLYRMNDVTIRTRPAQSASPSVGLPGKHPDITRREVTLSNVTFADIPAHKNRAAIEALAAREIINGKSEEIFAPDANMTRAEFATIVVRALGLTPKANDAFTDVKSSDWFAPFVGTAASYGLINGVGDGKFDPSGSITREQAAVLVSRAAQLCGIDTGMTADRIRDSLAQFTDYITVSSWAQEGTALCYSKNILDQSDISIRPRQPILRGEVAQMLYNLLSLSNLI